MSGSNAAVWSRPRRYASAVTGINTVRVCRRRRCRANRSRTPHPNTNTLAPPPCDLV